MAQSYAQRTAGTPSLRWVKHRHCSLQMKHLGLLASDPEPHCQVSWGERIRNWLSQSTASSAPQSPSSPPPTAVSCDLSCPGKDVYHLEAKGSEDGSDGAAHQPEDEELKHDA